MTTTNGRTRSTSRTLTAATTVFAAGGLALTTLAGPAHASPPRGPETSGAGGPAAASPYAEPIEALGGQTLAQYLADHMDRRLR